MFGLSSGGVLAYCVNFDVNSRFYSYVITIFLYSQKPRLNSFIFITHILRSGDVAVSFFFFLF